MAGITINGNTINPAAVPGVSQTAERTNFILIQGRDVDLSLEQKLELEDHFHVEIKPDVVAPRTSMTTPLVASCAALLREALQERGKQHIKALLVNRAEHFSQAIAPVLGYDHEQGFGRVNVQRSIAAVRELAFIGGGNDLENTRFDVPALRQSAEQERQWQSAEIPLQSGRNRIIVTLAYPVLAGGLPQYDLNLIVQSAGDECHGNMGKGHGFDHTNNVEKVIWDNVLGSTFKVVVKVHSITRPRDTAPFAVSRYISTLAKI